MKLDEPFALGPFTIDGAGRLQPTDPRAMPEFSLVWRGCDVRVRFEPAPDPHQATMELCTGAGRVPSTALVGSQLRAEVFSALAALPGLLPSGWRVDLLADHRLELAGHAALALPATVSELLSAVTVHLLRAAPYLDLLGEAGVVAARASAGGSVNIWPG